MVNHDSLIDRKGRPKMPVTWLPPLTSKAPPPIKKTDKQVQPVFKSAIIRWRHLLWFILYDSLLFDPATKHLANSNTITFSQTPLLSSYHFTKMQFQKRILENFHFGTFERNWLWIGSIPRNFPILISWIFHTCIPWEHLRLREIQSSHVIEKIVVLFTCLQSLRLSCL